MQSNEMKLNDNKKYQSTSVCSNETHTEIHHKIFDSPIIEPKKEHIYTITEEDSLFGLALKYDITVQTIMNWNNLSDENVYPGQKIKLYLNKYPSDIYNIEINSFLLEQDSFILQDKNPHFHQNYDNLIFIDWEDLLANEISNIDVSLRVDCYYCTSYGDIYGELTVNDTMIFFNPDFNNKDNKVKLDKKSFIKFQACLDVRDIIRADIIKLPEKTNNNNYLQILLASIGECKNPIYQKKAQEFIQKKKPMASIFFKLIFHENLKINDDKLLTLTNKFNNLIEFVQKFGSPLKNPNSSSLTRVPFYDIVSSNKEIKSQKKIKEEETSQKNPYLESHSDKKIEISQEQTTPKKLKPIYLLKLSDSSSILSDIQFSELVDNLPPVLKLCHWNLSYATTKHGTCFDVLFRLVGNLETPNLLVIRDYEKNVFGAYFNEGWKRRKLFYGTGETFLFTFKKGETLTKYSWTHQNNFFLLTNGECGICIGSGDYYGLYIHPDLNKGYSYPSETFNNDFLTDKKDFDVERLEIWNVDYDEY